ncbi:hypothetical protein [Rugamonas sp. DEMB1]|uniref:hypothetical protein n=1 Tax=Rugamonas sp. DEMB1 TaxID=3039386 RepID=UPI00244CC768|nr:hypothetical protein [Rugamonas sp. DEMB1]WGG52096.1 hypothetical protein QC826_07930 [Rugamonas sp. DEMB1]
MTRTNTFVSLAILAAAIFAFSSAYSPARHESAKLRADIRAPKPQSALERPMNGFGLSPFSLGAPVPPDPTEIIKQRKQIMTAGGYTTPEKYFYMNVKELTDLGRAGDVFASLQLGERYWNEAKSLEYDPDMDYSDAPKNIAVRHFLVAIREGAGNVIPIVAKRMLEDGEIIDAVAWNMISQRGGQLENQKSFNQSRNFSKLSYEQLNAAQKKANDIASELGITL